MKLVYKVSLILIVGFLVVVLINSFYIRSSIEDSLKQSGSEIASVTDEMLFKTVQDTAKSIVRSQTNMIEAYVTEHKITTIQEFSRDMFIRKSLSATWYKEEYSFVLGVKPDGTIITVVHPNEDFLLKTPFEIGIPEKSPSFYELMKTVAQLNPGEYASGYYEWEGKKKFGVFYMSDIVLKDETDGQEVFLAIGTAVYEDSYIRDILRLGEEKNPSDIVLASLENINHALKTSTATSLFLAFLVILAFVYIINTVISKPIIDLSNTAESIAEGNVEMNVPYQGRDDEIGILANAIEKVRRSLEIAMKTLEEFT